MDVEEALDHWMDGHMTVKELFLATGFRKLQDVYLELQYERQDLENERDLDDMSAFLKQYEQDELEAEARYQWHHLLQERPEYLEACVRALRAKKQRQLSEIGRRMTPSRAN